MKYFKKILFLAGLFPLAATGASVQDAAFASTAASADANPSLVPFASIGASAIVNSPEKIHGLTYLGGVVGGGVIWREHHLFAAQVGYFTGAHTEKNLVPLAGDSSELPLMEGDHSCCVEPAAPSGYDYLYQRKHQSDLVPLFLSYNFVWHLDAAHDFTLRAGPSVGVIFVSSSVSITEESDGYRYQAKYSKSTVTYGGGLAVAAAWRFDNAWTVEAGYRFFATPSYSVVNDWKTGANLNHQITLAFTRKF